MIVIILSSSVDFPGSQRLNTVITSGTPVLNNRMRVVNICAQGGSAGLSQKFLAKQHGEAGNNHYTDTLNCPSSEKG